MKVAIIGAGTAGLSCAIELERNGIYPVIFERNGFIGDPFSHVSAFMGLLTRPVADPLLYINRELGIRLEPLNTLNKVIHYSPENQVAVTGPLGYLLIRGKGKTSVQGQLYQQIKSRVCFNSFVRPEELEKEFDYVIVADGMWTTPERFGIWREVMRAWLKGAIFTGDFDEHAIMMWVDNELTNGAYTYAAPYNKKKAVIAHIVQNIEHEDLNDYWHRFLDSRGILKKYNMVETWELPHRAGYLTTNRVRNIYFVGAAGGGAEPFLGFGQFNSVLSGVMAARSIVNGSDFRLLLKNAHKKSRQLTTLRPLLNTATNKGFDIVFSLMKIPGLRTLIYRTNIDIIKLISAMMKFVPFKDKKQAELAKGRV